MLDLIVGLTFGYALGLYVGKLIGKNSRLEGQIETLEQQIGDQKGLVQKTCEAYRK